MLKQLASNIFQSVSRQKSAARIINVRFQSTDYSKCEGLLIEPKNQVLWIKFNRPEKYNAITGEMYQHLTDTFNKVNGDKSIRAVVLTGNGDYYSSGNDLTNITHAMQDEGGLRAGFTKSKDLLIEFVDSLINLEKFLIAATNGPAVGIPVSTLPLCDYVIASDRATFQTPFTALGFCPEACSSVTMPQIMGSTRANELLLLNKIWDAKKAQNYGLVSEVIEHDKFHTHLENFIYGKQGLINTCYPQSMMISKSLLRDSVTKKRLLDANRRESNALLERWLGEESADAIQKFFKRSKK